MNTPIFPEKGFYYHYKHFLPENVDSVDLFAYEICGGGHHTEEDGTFFMIYRPLYKTARVYQEGKLFDVRPIEMVHDMIPPAKSGLEKEVSRFTRITDQEVIAQLTEMKDEMYS